MNKLTSASTMIYNFFDWNWNFSDRNCFVTLLNNECSVVRIISPSLLTEKTQVEAKTIHADIVQDSNMGLVF